MGFVVKTGDGYIKKISTFNNTVEMTYNREDACIHRLKEDAVSLAHVAHLITGQDYEIEEC